MRNKLFSYPLVLVGVILIILGARWMLVEEPWMLDEVANVERLEMTFDKLFEPEINKTTGVIYAEIVQPNFLTT